MSRGRMQDVEQEAKRELEAAYKESAEGKDIATPERVSVIPPVLQEQARKELEGAHEDERRGRQYQTGPESSEWRGVLDEPGTFLAPDHGWQCPSCGTMFEQQGVCPVDATPLKLIHKWEWTLPATGRTESVMDRGDDLYPAPTPEDWPLTAGRTA